MQDLDYNMYWLWHDVVPENLILGIYKKFKRLDIVCLENWVAYIWKHVEFE